LDLAQNWQNLETAWGTQWGDWQNQGEPEVNRSTQTRNNTNGGDFGFGGTSLSTETQTQTEIVREVQRQTREGTRLNVAVNERVQRSGPFLTRTDIVPFMRSRAIEFRGTGMRPNTRVLFLLILIEEQFLNSVHRLIQHLLPLVLKAVH